MLKCLKIWACIIQKFINQSFIRDNKKTTQKLLSVHERTCFTEHKNCYMKKKYMLWWNKKVHFLKNRHALLLEARRIHYLALSCSISRQMLKDDIKTFLKIFLTYTSSAPAIFKKWFFEGNILSKYLLMNIEQFIEHL